jgi:hypothetical protein
VEWPKPRIVLPFFQETVPEAQQPTAELVEARRQPFMTWAESDTYEKKLRGLYVFIMGFFSLPISYVTYDRLPQEFPNLFLAANMGTFAVMIFFIVRLWVNWGYVGRRLKERQTYYEANERGLSAEKDDVTVYRDRLLYEQNVAPVLGRINASLAATSLALALSLGSGEALTVFQGENGPATLKTLTGADASNYTTRLRSDLAFATREQQRAQRRADEDGTGLKPLYCDSRYYKILAGGNGQGGVGCSEGE